MKKYILLWWVIFSAIVIFALSAFYVTQKVWVYSDGSVHVNIINYIIKEKKTPKEDFSGQININFRQSRSITTPMIYPQNLYILFAYLSVILWINSLSIYTSISILITIISWIFFFKISKLLTQSDKIGFISTLIFFLIPFWYWSLVRRIVEPTSMILCFTLLYISIKRIKKLMLIHQILIWLFLFLIFYTKQSNLYFVAIIVIFLLYNKVGINNLLKIWIFWLLTWLPAIINSFMIFGSISPVPPWIPIIDTKILNPRRKKQLPMGRENNLNILVNNDAIKKLTLKQFTMDVQISNFVYLERWEYKKLIQNLLPLQISNTWTQGYHLELNNSISSLNFLLFIFWILYIIWNYKKNKKYFLFLISTISIVLLFSIKFTVFRYYINIVILNIVLFTYWILFISSKKNYLVSLICISTFVIFTLITLNQQVNKDLQFKNSIWHKLTNNKGWFYEFENTKSSMKFSWDIFTPILEAAYYYNKNIYRDEKFFFIKKEEDLIYYLNKAWIKYIINPFYSNTIPRSKRKYYNWIPSDSTFWRMLKNQDCFKLISNQLSFDAYEIKSECLIKND